MKFRMNSILTVASCAGMFVITFLVYKTAEAYGPICNRTGREYVASGGKFAVEDTVQCGQNITITLKVPGIADFEFTPNPEVCDRGYKYRAETTYACTLQNSSTTNVKCRTVTNGVKVDEYSGGGCKTFLDTMQFDTEQLRNDWKTAFSHCKQLAKRDPPFTEDTAVSKSCWK